MGTVELEIALAEHVMGWQPLKNLDGGFWGNKRTRMVLGTPVAEKRRAMKITDRAGDAFVFAPTVCHRDSVELLRRMREKGWHYRIDVRGDEVRVRFQYGDIEVGAEREDGDDLLAICEAAYKAEERAPAAMEARS